MNGRPVLVHRLIARLNTGGPAMHVVHLAEALESALTSPPSLEERERSRGLVLERFAIGRLARDIERMYEDALDRAGLGIGSRAEQIGDDAARFENAAVPMENEAKQMENEAAATEKEPAQMEDDAVPIGDESDEIKDHGAEIKRENDGPPGDRA